MYAQNRFIGLGGGFVDGHGNRWVVVLQANELVAPELPREALDMALYLAVLP